MTAADAAIAGDIHRRGGALIPGYDTSLHTVAEDLAFHQQVIAAGDSWGLLDGTRMLGWIALLPGWIDHLYVEPALLRRGIGSRLIAHAKAAQPDLRLYTFQSNARARAFYESHGFVIEEMTDGQRNEEKMPDMTYHWQANDGPLMPAGGAVRNVTPPG